MGGGTHGGTFTATSEASWDWGWGLQFRVGQETPKDGEHPIPLPRDSAQLKEQGGRFRE